MTFAELKAAVSYTLDDLNFGYFTETQVGLWLNQSQRRLQKRLIKAGQNFYTKCVQTTLVVNQNDYVLPEDFKEVNKLVVVVSGSPPNESLSPVLPITMGQQTLMGTGVGTPCWYVIKKNRLSLSPAPDTALPLRLIYTYDPVDMVLSSDVPDIPVSYHEFLVLLASQQGFIKDGRENALITKKILEFEGEIDTDAAQRNVDQPRQIVETGINGTNDVVWW